MSNKNKKNNNNKKRFEPQRSNKSIFKISITVLIIIAIILIIVFALRAYNKHQTEPLEPEELGSIKIEETTTTVNPLDYVDIYSEGEKIETPTLEEEKDKEMVKATVYFLNNDIDSFSEKAFIPKTIDYEKGNIDSLLAKYNYLIGERMDTETVDKGDKLYLNFVGFDTYKYESNKVLQSTFRDEYGLNYKGKLLVLEGYYHTIKANFPQFKYIFFKYAGQPFELIPNENHFGLLFLEKGQTLPEKRPYAYLWEVVPDYVPGTDDWPTGEHAYSGDRVVSDRNLDYRK